MSGITDHRKSDLAMSGNLTILGKLLSTNNKTCVAAASTLIETNAIGTPDAYEGHIAFSADAITDYFHISNILGYQTVGATVKITGLEIYVGDMVAPDKIDFVKLRHVKVVDGTVVTDWENLDDKTIDEGTIPYTDINITLATDCLYFFEILLDAGTTNFDIRGFGFIYDLV